MEQTEQTRANLNGVNTMIEIAVFAIFLYQLYKRLRVNPRFID
jgi:hypothetical protein